ncbi:MAG: Ankyrin [Proteobacteria bacterium]|nr:Ankyrin [Pseudomonadota bacterium]
MSMHSALRRAIEKGCLQSVRTALDHGAAIEEADMHGDPGLPMRIACFQGHTDIVRELIQRGADIHAPNAQGLGGPIRMAARGQHAEIIDLLVEHGAEVPEDVQLPKKEAGERRKRGDRRRRDMGPPSNLRDRRQSRERRVVSVRELELSDLQWERYFAETQPAAPRQIVDHHFDETASVIFERVRD